LYSLSVSSLLGSFKIGGLILLGLTLYVVFSLLKHPWYILEHNEMVIWELEECWSSFSEIMTFIVIEKDCSLCCHTLLT